MLIRTALSCGNSCFSRNFFLVKNILQPPFSQLTFSWMLNIINDSCVILNYILRLKFFQTSLFYNHQFNQDYPKNSLNEHQNTKRLATAQIVWHNNNFKVNNKTKTKTRCKIESRLTLKTADEHHWCHFGDFIVNFEYIFTPYANIYLINF